MEKNDSLFKVIRSLIFFLLAIAIIQGLIDFNVAIDNEHPIAAVINSMLIMVCLATMMWLDTIKKADTEEIEQLRTEIALLQNRIEYLEDDMCKEYKEGN